MAEIFDLSVLAASNTARFPEGMTAAGLNDSARELEAMLARTFKDQSAQLITAGSASAYTITSNRTFSSYAAGNGMAFLVRFHVAGNATPTFNVNSLGAKTLVRASGSSIVAGDITLNMISWVCYDSANDRFSVMALDDREKAAVYTTATQPASAAANQGILTIVTDPPGSNTEPTLAYDTGARIAYLRERNPVYTSAAGAYQRPTSSATTSGKISLRSDHVQGTVLAFDTGSAWKDVDDVLDIYTTATLPASGSSTKGWIVFDDTTDSLAVFGGSDWRAIPVIPNGLVGPQLPSYTVAGLPSAATNTRVVVWCSNETGGATPVFSDGTNWRRVSDRAIAS